MVKVVEVGGIDDYWDVLQLILFRMPSVAVYKLLQGEDKSWPSLQAHKPKTLDKLAKMIVEESRFTIADWLNYTSLTLKDMKKNRRSILKRP